MSLYNMLHGVNPIAGILLSVLGIDQENGAYKSGRFRDIYLNKDASKIVLYTRNGGGNRETYQEVIDKLATHPNYLADYDDDFDCTYAYIEFSTPERFKEVLKGFATGKEPMTVGEKFKEVTKEMEGMTKEELEKDPRFAPTVEMLKFIFEERND